MATLIIRQLSDETQNKLRRLAARHGRSVEEEARRLLDLAVSQESRKGLGTRIHQQIAGIDGVDLGIPARSPIRQPPNFEDESA